MIVKVYEWFGFALDDSRRPWRLKNGKSWNWK
jgi:hypothetical protein